MNGTQPLVLSALIDRVNIKLRRLVGFSKQFLLLLFIYQRHGASLQVVLIVLERGGRS